MVINWNRENVQILNLDQKQIFRFQIIKAAFTRSALNSALNLQLSIYHPMYFKHRFELTSKLSAPSGISLKEFINSRYSLVDEKFPVGLCSTCRFKLCDYEKTIFKRPKPTMPNQASRPLLYRGHNRFNVKKILLVSFIFFV